MLRGLQSCAREMICSVHSIRVPRLPRFRSIDIDIDVTFTVPRIPCALENIGQDLLSDLTADHGACRQLCYCSLLTLTHSLG